MVGAEIPLWVLHSTKSATSSDGHTTSTTVFPLATTATGPHVARATESIAFLGDTSGSKQQKCAIYSVDMHPDGSKFATGGGDGTVRLWNSAALFRGRGGSYTGDRNAYTSTSDSDGGGNMTSDTDEGNLTGVASSTDGQGQQQENGHVHDLSQLVRRKKDGSTPLKQPPTLTAKSTGVALAPSPQQVRESHHRLLCTMSAHTGSSVLAVRFSTSGHYLASAGDDTAICIYVKGGNSSAVGNLDQNRHHIEQWTRIKLCRGHSLDVVGLAWAPDDSHLVSCSLDSDAPIVVWKLTDLVENNTNNGGSTVLSASQKILCHPYKILGKGIHTSTVKGVTFDPAGTYLASSGDDPAVCIWRAHDDWGLEKRIDDGIFRKWKDDERELSSQTLFRRLSWSTDGTYICSTNGTVKNKHVASTISREGWSVSSSQSVAAGAANLVGHKQPVVVSRHCPHLLDVRNDRQVGEPRGSDNEDDEEPEYATLVALGDKRGFVSVWSTRKSRPIFKLQCSETGCTVTDLSWGRTPNGNEMILLVSLLDGQIVALKFGVPSELGHFLNDRDQKRVFLLRYGIDLGDDGGMGGRRMFVGDRSAPRLIENALQFALEEKKDDGDTEGIYTDVSAEETPIGQMPSPGRVKQAQSETQSKGKKRIRPVLMTVSGSETTPMNGNEGAHNRNGSKKKKQDRVLDALESAERAASTAEGLAAAAATVTKRDSSQGDLNAPGDRSYEPDQANPSRNHHPRLVAVPPPVVQAQIPHSTRRVHSVDLPFAPDAILRTNNTDEACHKMVADCTNIMHIPGGSIGQSLQCAILSISRGGKGLWKDDILGTACSAIAATARLMAVGTADGIVYLYGTSPTIGWASGAAFRSLPPLVVGHAVVALQLVDETEERIRLLVVTSDGFFGVFTLLPECKLVYKGSILPAMTHMGLSTTVQSKQLPELARIQITETDHLFLILSVESPKTSGSQPQESSLGRSSQTAPSFGVGGALQAFVYHRDMELWLRVSDSRFLLSDFYSTLPSASQRTGVLVTLDNAVRSGSSSSSLMPSRAGGGGTSSSIYHATEEEDGSHIVTRSHCEDRLACALALNSGAEFREWFTLYVRTLTMGGHVDHLRFVVDLLLGNPSSSMMSSSSCWWLSSAPTVLGLDRKELAKTVVVPEMSKNRSLQRVTNELAIELDAI